MGTRSSLHLEQFYTRPDVAARCVAFMAGLPGVPDKPWIEPSAGTGAFLDHMPPGSVGIDLDPRHPGVARADFLAWRPGDGRDDHVVVGNPPFGRQSSLLVRFFNHAAGFASHIGFVMPRSFEKEHLQRQLDRRFHPVASLPIEADVFLHSGRTRHVPCVFMAWERRPEPRRPRPPVTSHPHFDFVDRERADFAFQRIGRNAGRVLADPRALSVIPHYFIAVRETGADVAGVLAGIDWSEEKARNAGVPSIGKAELVRRYAEAVGNPPARQR
jgi:hypothetical protein